MSTDLFVLSFCAVTIVVAVTITVTVNSSSSIPTLLFFPECYK